MVVRGSRLSLRYPRPDDAQALFEMGRDPEVTRFLSWGPYRNIEEPRQFIAHTAEAREAGEILEFVIAGPDDVPIGVTALSEFSPRDRRAVVGTWVGKQHWGTGANRESKVLILTLAFRKLELLRVSAYAHPENVRSVRALERLGFTPEGVLVGWHIHRGVRRDVRILRLLREEWEAGALAREPAEVEGEPPSRISAGNSVPQ
jgi:ribosomal-protein-alanine N-acetyltransferase